MPEPLPVIGLVAQVGKPQVRQVLQTFARELLRRGVELRVEEVSAAEVPEAECGDRAFVLGAKAVITLGGDGTLLGVAREVAPAGTPVLGIDLGSFGFLADQSPQVVLDHLDDLIEGRYSIEERMMLTATAEEALGSCEGELLALNEIVLAKVAHRHLIWVHCEVDGSQMATYAADGVIIATPTGSTAYSLSAGGPIIDPRVDCLSLVAICPHTLYSRPVVIDPSSRVRLWVERRPGKPDEDIAVVADGQGSRRVRIGEGVVVQRARCTARLIRIAEVGFYDRLREKLNWDAPR